MFFPSMIFVKNSIVIVLISLLFLVCWPTAPVVNRTEPTIEITPADLITQEVKVIDDPLSGELINCPVVVGIAQDDNPWVKIEREEVEFINIIERDTKGRMWLATDGHGLSMLDGKEWHNWQPETGRDMGYVAFRTMAASDTKVFAGAYGSASGGNLLIYDIEQDKWETIRPGKDSLSGNVIGGVAVNQQGQLFVATTAGIDSYSNGKWTRLGTPDRAEYGNQLVKDALIDHKGNYWIAAGQASGVWKYDGQFWTTFTANDGYLPSSEVTALAVDSKNKIWAATTKGLAVYDEDEVWHVFSAEKFSWFNGWLNDVAVDSQDRIWVVSNDFLTVYNGKEIATFKPSIIGESLWDDAIGFDQQGCVWVDTSLKLAILRGKLNMEAGESHFE